MNKNENIYTIIIPIGTEFVGVVESKGHTIEEIESFVNECLANCIEKGIITES